MERPEDPIHLKLLDELRQYPGVSELPHRPELPNATDLLGPIHLQTPLGEMRLLTIIGAPYDITLEELRLETLLPADTAAENVLRSLTA